MSQRAHKLSIDNQSSIATGSAVLRYGAAETITLGRPYGVPRRAPSIRFKFLVGEVTGIVFIALSSLFVLFVPASMARAGALRLAMKRAIKRTLDVVGAAAGLILAAPLMIVIAGAIKLDSPGPVFYTQTRVGVNRRKGDRRYFRWVGVADNRQGERRREDLFGRPFRIVKFRTMIQDAEKKTGPVWATQNDPRITRLGRFLRRMRMDEIPQFWSVLKGDMSLVGPRPERPAFVRDLSEKVDGYHKRLEVKPGLTGLAQVENGYDSSLSSVQQKVGFDLKYISVWSFWTDVRILAKTVVVVMTGKGAY